MRAVACLLLAVLLGWAAPALAAESEEKVLRIYNWADYISENAIADFERETGIAVQYDSFDDIKMLEAKVAAGGSGYDLVVPNLQFLARQVQAGHILALDKSRLSHYDNLDPILMARMAELDPDNAHALNWLWGSTGIGIDEQKVAAILGPNAALDSWALLFKPENISRLSACGVAVIDRPGELLPIALNYLGEDPNSTDAAVIGRAVDLLKKIRPYIREFDSSAYIDELANGSLCVAVGWSGDVLMAQARRAAVGGSPVRYVLPKEGAPMWFDMIAIPSDAPHPDNAHRFLDFLLRPEVMAGISNFAGYANANRASTPLLDPSITGNPNLSPNADTLQRMFVLALPSPETEALYARVWKEIKGGAGVAAEAPMPDGDSLVK